jgi:hypothetical protein
LKTNNVKALFFSSAPDTQKNVALFEDSEASDGFPSDSSSINMKMSMDRRKGFLLIAVDEYGPSKE